MQLNLKRAHIDGEKAKRNREAGRTLSQSALNSKLTYFLEHGLTNMHYNLHYLAQVFTLFCRILI